MNNPPSITVFSAHITNMDTGATSMVFPSRDAFFEWVAKVTQEKTLEPIWRVLDTIDPLGFKHPANIADKDYAASVQDHAIFRHEIRNKSGRHHWILAEDSVLLQEHRMLLSDVNVSDSATESLFSVHSISGGFADISVIAR